MNPYEDVKLFMETFGQDTPTTLGFPDQSVRNLRRKLNQEELAEIEHGEATNDIVEVADGIADLIYVLVGQAIAYGIDLPAVWEAVQTANMSKLWKEPLVFSTFNLSLKDMVSDAPITVTAAKHGLIDVRYEGWTVTPLPLEHPLHIRQLTLTRQRDFENLLLTLPEGKREIGNLAPDHLAYVHAVVTDNIIGGRVTKLYVVKNEHGKVQKPPTWKAPSIYEVLKNQPCPHCKAPYDCPAELEAPDQVCNHPCHDPKTCFQATNPQASSSSEEEDHGYRGADGSNL